MIKHLQLKKVLATLLTLAALLAGQQAFATITSPMSLTGNSALVNGQYYHVWKTEGFLGNYSQPRTPGNSYTFNGQPLSLQGGDVRITGTLNFTESNDFTDVTTGSTVTVEFYSTNFWFFNAEVKKLDGTSVSGCSYSASSDHTSITVTIPSGKTFGNIYLGYSVHPQMTESNTTISGIEATYIYQGSAIKPQPTVVYTNPNHSQTTLTLNTDYTLSYTSNNGPGTATVIITGAGEYAGTLTRTYTIRNIDLSDFNSLGNNIYEIANKDDLDHLALLVDYAANDCQGLTFRQSADIAYSHGSSTTENNFTQIGGYFDGDKNFSGTYDGQNHTISGIRVYKSPTNSANANKNVALFGRISTGATIQNVILTDARITGYRYVGGLVGNKASGTVQNCLVVGSTITCGNTYWGALFGSNSGTLTANYYRNCTVNNTTNATNVGVGSSSSSNDMAGARSIHTLTIQNANVTATGESVAYQGTTYYASNTQITLGYNNLPAGYAVTYTLNGTALTGNTFTMPANDNATVNATLTLITYNITYDLDGGSTSSPQANPTTYNVTTPTFTLNNPTKAGYTFTGWTGSNGTTPQTEVTIAQGSTGDRSYTAHWSLDTYNITYDLDGGSVATANPTTYNVTTPTFTLNNPTKAICTFDGWTGTGLNEATQTVTIAQGSTGDRSYTAQWTQYAFTLTLGANITASGTVAFTLDGTDYYATGTEITLAYSGNIPESQHLVFYVNGTPIANNGNTFAMPAANATVSVALHDWPGSGTENDPFIISTTAELDLLSYAVRNYVCFSDRKYFKLGADIAYDPNVLNANGTNYTAIGPYRPTHDSFTFAGSFDGDGHTISGIRSSQGLFGKIYHLDDFICTVKNVTLADAVITGNDYIGGIVGVNEGQIEDCQVINTVINGNLAVGGIAGWMDGDQIESCQVINADINGAQALGGITGLNSSGSIENCLALDTDITATHPNYPDGGAIAGVTNSHLTSNYYHGCNVNNETSGIGTCDGDITENDGAVQVFSLSIGGNVTATPDPVVAYDGTGYYFAGTTITLVYGGTIPEGCSLSYSVNGNAIVGNSFEMPTQDVAVSLTKQGLRYTFDSNTGALALIWGDFNKNNKWGSEVTASKVRSVTATSDVSFTGDCYHLFNNFTNCTSMNLSNVNTDALTNMSSMFSYCPSLTTLDLSGWNTANVTDMSGMFSYCSSLTTLDLSGWNTANVTDMSYMFFRSTSLQSLNLSGWNTANVTDMSYMFRECSGLQSLAISGWNIAKVTDMQQMFEGCSSLQSLDLSDWNTANVTDMYQMFEGCSSLQSLNISGWNTANVTEMSRMFYGCSNLQSLDLSGWNTANVTDMSSMFDRCSGLQSPNLSGWNTAKVTNMNYLFWGCSGLQSLNLSGWNTANVTNMFQMFRGCTNLATIYVGEGWNTSRVNWSTDMFNGCTLLVGGMGTTYDADHTDGEYARIDRGPESEQPGYLTGRFNKDIAGYGTGTGGWYLIASPVPSITPSPDNGFITDDDTNPDNRTYDLYYFDQTGGTNGKEWKNYRAHPEFTSLVSGQGYLYASKNGTTLIFSGAPYSGEGQVDLTYFEVNGNQGMWGWNLIGNPFAETANLPSGLSYYTLNDTRSELIAGNASTIGAMEAIFVKATGTGQSVQFTKQSRGGISTLRQAQGLTTTDNAILSLNLTDNHNRLIDRAIVRFDEGQPLPKFQIRENSTKVYIPQKGKDYAVINVCTEGACTVSTEMPVNFKAEENGEYTITVNTDHVEMSYLHLIDNMTGNDVDLLAAKVPEPAVAEPGRSVEGPTLNDGVSTSSTTSYTFTAKTTDYESRFRLVFSTVCGDAASDNETFAFMSNGHWIIANEGEATLQVIDLNGRILSNETVKGSVSKAINTSAGVYVLRLINGDDVRTQKIVVR